MSVGPMGRTAEPSSSESAATLGAVNNNIWPLFIGGQRGRRAFVRIG